MTRTIDKDPHDRAAFRRRGGAPTDGRVRVYTASARAALAHVLAHLPGDGRILAPAYLGVSPNEGSGVWDPIVASGRPCALYRVGADLAADVAHVAALLAEAPAAAVLAIHYFGAAEPAIDRLAQLARDHGAALIEDCAHVTPCARTARLGSVGEHAIYSLHKVIAAPTGGYLASTPAAAPRAPLPAALAIDPDVAAQAEATDWDSIAAARVANYQGLAARVAAIDGVRVFWPELPAGAVPHTLPVVVTGADRFAVYRAMRAAGVGVVALYHTLIPASTRAEFPAAHELARTILNLPIHPEVTAADHAVIAGALADAVARA